MGEESFYFYLWYDFSQFQSSITFLDNFWGFLFTNCGKERRIADILPWILIVLWLPIFFCFYTWHADNTHKNTLLMSLKNVSESEKANTF